MATAGLGSMRNVAEQPTQTVMRADGLQQVLGGCKGCLFARRVKGTVVNQANIRTSFAEVPGRSGKSGINSTH